MALYLSPIEISGYCSFSAFEEGGAAAGSTRMYVYRERTASLDKWPDCLSVEASVRFFIGACI